MSDELIDLTMEDESEDDFPSDTSQPINDPVKVEDNLVEYPMMEIIAMMMMTIL